MKTIWGKIDFKVNWCKHDESRTMDLLSDFQTNKRILWFSHIKASSDRTVKNDFFLIFGKKIDESTMQVLWSHFEIRTAGTFRDKWWWTYF